MLDGLRDYTGSILVFGIPLAAGAALFIWRHQNLARRGVTVSALCTNTARDAKGLVTLRLMYEVDGRQYHRNSMPYQFPPIGVGQRLDIIYDAKTPEYAEVVEQRGRGRVPWFVGGIALLFLVLLGLAHL
ncbi:hypothetical protein DI272_22895 [Streptomyces sp. Act143]|uniref:DUF3592 domain-containing protein n=1 Tax=Streptomyces sp. Act143 TaxID=2200760 RepID=UPI000D682C2F|nr:DUF3592 domain-containing protein [Streptomyces sp. Act143]PWI16692.1 hypothetical protein DI272_22895 [Streptomyces sp. Act143]